MDSVKKAKHIRVRFKIPLELLYYNESNSITIIAVISKNKLFNLNLNAETIRKIISAKFTPVEFTTLES